MPVVFLIDESSYMSMMCDEVLSFLETAKTLMENFIRHYGSAFNHQIMLLTYSSVNLSPHSNDVNLKVGWNDGPRQLEYHLKSLKIGSSQTQIDIAVNKRVDCLSKAILEAFSLLNRYRLSENLDNIGCGNRPWISTSSACIVLTAAPHPRPSSLNNAGRGVTDLPSIDFCYSCQTSLPLDAEFFSSYHRWDQRLYSVILASPTENSINNDQFVSWLDKECRLTGGWAIKPYTTSALSVFAAGSRQRGSRSQLWSKIYNDLEIICEDLLKRGVNIQLTSNDGDNSSRFLVRVTAKELSNRVMSRDDSQVQTDCGSWPIPETCCMETKPFRPRPDFPCIWLDSVTADDENMLVELQKHCNLPYDTYSLSLSMANDQQLPTEFRNFLYYLSDQSSDRNLLIAKMGSVIESGRSEHVRLEWKSVGYVRLTSDLLASVNSNRVTEIGELIILPLNFQRLATLVSRLTPLYGRIHQIAKSESAANRTLSDLRGDMLEVLRSCPAYYYVYLQSCFHRNLPWVIKMLDMQSFPQDNRKQLSIRLYEVRQRIEESINGCVNARMYASRQSTLVHDHAGSTQDSDVDPDNSQLSYSCSFAPFAFSPALEAIPSFASEISEDQALAQWDRMRSKLYDGYGKTRRQINLQRSGLAKLRSISGKEHSPSCLETCFENLSHLSRSIMDMSNYVEVAMSNEVIRNPELYDKLPTSTDWTKNNCQAATQETKTPNSDQNKQLLGVSPSSPSITREEINEESIVIDLINSTHAESGRYRNVQLEYDVSREMDVSEILRYKTSVDLANPFRRKNCPFYLGIEPQLDTASYVRCMNLVSAAKTINMEQCRVKIDLGTPYKRASQSTSNKAPVMKQTSTAVPIIPEVAEEEKQVQKHKLPPGWTEQFSSQKKKVYYYNSSTNESQWQFPK